MQPFIERQG